MFILFGVQLNLDGYAQEMVNSDAFFKRTISDSRSLQHEYDKQNISLPWIETYEFRTESREFDHNRQRYAARFTPTSPGIRKSQSDLFNHYKRKLSLVETAYLNDKIEEAYSLWTSLYFKEEKLAVYSKLKNINEDKLKVYKKQVQKEDFNYAQLIDTQKEINALSVQIHELQISLKTEKIPANLNGEELNFDDMISIDQIEEVLNDDREFVPVDVEYFYEKELIDKEIALEKAVKRKIFDFAQIEYGGPHDELMNERISLGFALKIPTSGAKNLKIEEMRIEQQELDLEHQIMWQEIAEKTMDHLLKAQSKIEIYKTLKELRNTEHQAYVELSNFIAKEKGEDPIFLLNINENTEKDRLDHIKRKEEIYEEYLAYLVLSKKMFESPFTNYLFGIPSSFELTMEE